jgi:hypothetical protein
MTKEYYFAVFGKTKVSEEDKKLLLVERSADAEEFFENEEHYSRKILYRNDFSDNLDTIVNQSGIFRMDSVVQFSPGPDVAFKNLTARGHAWIRAGVKIFIPGNYREEFPKLVITFHHRGEPYKYFVKTIPSDKIKYGGWNDVRADYLTPEVRSPDDNLKIYVWHTGKMEIFIDENEVFLYEPD